VESKSSSGLVQLASGALDAGDGTITWGSLSVHDGSCCVVVSDGIVSLNSGARTVDGASSDGGEVSGGWVIDFLGRPCRQPLAVWRCREQYVWHDGDAHRLATAASVQ
jgi:hypothetical protein